MTKLTPHLRKVCEVLHESGYGIIRLDLGFYPYAYKTNESGDIIHPDARWNIDRLLDMNELNLIWSKPEWKVEELLQMEVEDA